MKALQITGPGSFEIKGLKTPVPKPGEVLIKVLAVTTCPHWDMHIFSGEPMFPGVPIEYPYMIGQPGHEACGDVAAVGDGVESLRVGDRVCVWRDCGHHRRGCYAQYVAVDVENVIAVPSALPPESCAPLELAMCAATHLLYAERLGPVKGKRVGVLGLGPAGQIFVQLLLAAGAADVVAFDPLPERRAMAEALGAQRVLDPNSEQAKAFPKRRQKGCLDMAFDCVGSGRAVHFAMDATNELVVLFAVQRETYKFTPRLWDGLALAGAQRHTREAAEYAARLVAEGKLDLGSLVTHTMRLDEYDRAVEMLRDREAVKVAFLPWE